MSEASLHPSTGSAEQALVFTDDHLTHALPMLGWDGFDRFLEEASEQGYLVSALDNPDQQVGVLPLDLGDQILVRNHPVALSGLLELANELVPDLAEGLYHLWAKRDQLMTADVVVWQRLPLTAEEIDWIPLAN